MPVSVVDKIASGIAADRAAAIALLPEARARMVQTPPLGLTTEQTEAWFDANIESVISAYMLRFAVSRRANLLAYRNALFTMGDIAERAVADGSAKAEFGEVYRKALALTPEAIDAIPSENLHLALPWIATLYGQLCKTEAHYTKRTAKAVARSRAIVAEMPEPESKDRTEFDEFLWAETLGQRIMQFCVFMPQSRDQAASCYKTNVTTRDPGDVEAARWLWTELAPSLASWRSANGNPYQHARVSETAKLTGGAGPALAAFLGAYTLAGQVAQGWRADEPMPEMLVRPFPGDPTDAVARAEWFATANVPFTVEENVTEALANGLDEVEAHATLDELFDADMRFKLQAWVRQVWEQDAEASYRSVDEVLGQIQIVNSETFARLNWHDQIERVKNLVRALSEGVIQPNEEEGRVAEDDSALSVRQRAMRNVLTRQRDDILPRAVGAEAEAILHDLNFSDAYIPLKALEDFINDTMQDRTHDDILMGSSVVGAADLFGMFSDEFNSEWADDTDVFFGDKHICELSDELSSPDAVKWTAEEVAKEARIRRKESRDPDEKAIKNEDRVDEAKARVRPIILRREGPFVVVYVQADYGKVLRVPPIYMRVAGTPGQTIRRWFGIADGTAYVIAAINNVREGFHAENLYTRGHIQSNHNFMPSAPSITRAYNKGDKYGYGRGHVGKQKRLSPKVSSSNVERELQWGYMPESYVTHTPEEKFDKNGRRYMADKVTVRTFWEHEYLPIEVDDIGDKYVPRPFKNPYYQPEAAAEMEKANRPGYSKYMQDRYVSERLLTYLATFTSYLLKNKGNGGQYLDALTADYNARWNERGAVGLVEQGEDERRKIVRWGKTAHRLDDIQSQGVEWARHTQGGLIAYDVGVGKTLTALAAIAEARQSGNVRFPVVVVPKPIIPQWQRVIAETLPDYRVVTIGLGTEKVKRSVFLRRLNRVHQGISPDTGAEWTTEEIEERYERRGMTPHSKTEREKLWGMFAKGEFDIAIVTLPAFSAVDFDQTWLREYVRTTNAIQRALAAESKWGTSARAFDKTAVEWEEEKAKLFFHARTKMPMRGRIDLANSLLLKKPPKKNKETGEAEERTIGGPYMEIPDAFESFFTGKGVVLNADGMPVNPDTKLPFTNTEARKASRKEVERDRVLWGVRYPSAEDAAAGKIALPVDMIVADEAHHYKGLIVAEPRGFARGGKIAFMHEARSRSSRAWQLAFCAAATRALRGGSGGVLLLTATPAKATPLDLWNLLLLGAPDVLEGFGLDDPEAFITRFIGIEPSILVTAQANAMYGNIAAEFFDTLGEFRTLFNSIAVRRIAEDVERLRGDPVVIGPDLHDDGSHVNNLARIGNVTQSDGTESDDVEYGTLTVLPEAFYPDTNFKTVLAGQGESVRLRVMNKVTGEVASAHSIVSVSDDGYTLVLYPAFEVASINVRWEIRINAKVPLAAKPERVELFLAEGFQRDMYESAQYALIHDAGGSISSNLLMLTLHPAIASFRSEGSGCRVVGRRLFGIETDPVTKVHSAAESIWLSYDERQEVSIETAEAEGDEDEDDSAVDKKDMNDVLEFEEDYASVEEESIKETNRYKAALEQSLRFDEPSAAPADPAIIRANGIRIDPDPAANGEMISIVNPASVKFEAVCEKIIPSMITTSGDTHALSPGHLVFCEFVKADAFLFVLLRRRIAERRRAEIARIEAETKAAYPGAPSAEIAGVVENEVKRQLWRLRPERVTVMNGPSTAAASGTPGDPNEMQRISDGFNGETKLMPDGTIRFVHPPIYDVLIANRVAYEGVDLQVRTEAIHHVDLPWTFADFIQRNGRAVRQGNAYPVVKIYAYVVQQTLDLYQLRRVEGRRAWLETMLSGVGGYRLGESDDNTRIADILMALPPEFAAEREAELRKRFAELRESEAAANAAETLRAVRDFVKYSEEIANADQTLLSVATDKAAYSFGVLRIEAGVEAKTTRLDGWRTGVFGRLGQLRKKNNGSDAYPWVNRVVAQSRAGASVLIADIGQGKSARQEPVYAGQGWLDDKNNEVLVVLGVERRSSAYDKVHVLKRGYNWHRRGYDPWVIAAYPAKTVGNYIEHDWTPVPTPPVKDYMNAKFSVNDVSSIGMFPEEWIKANVVTQFRDGINLAGNYRNQPFRIDTVIPFLAGNVLLMTRSTQYIAWALGLLDAHGAPAAHPMASVMRDRIANANKKRAEAHTKKLAAENNKWRARVLKVNAENAAMDAKFAEVNTAYQIEKAVRAATIKSLTEALSSDQLDDAIARQPIPVPPTAPTHGVAKPEKIIPEPVPVPLPVEPPRPRMLLPTEAGWDEFKVAALATPGLEAETAVACAMNWFKRTPKLGWLAGSVAAAQFTTFKDEQVRLRGTGGQAKWPRLPNAENYGFDEAEMRRIEAAADEGMLAAIELLANAADDDDGDDIDRYVLADD